MVFYFYQILFMQGSEQGNIKNKGICQKYDESYKEKKQLGVFQSHILWMQNQYDPKTNRDGIINFGTSVNAVIPKTTIKYLPAFMRIQDCPYVDPRGYDKQFNEKTCEDTPFKWNETFMFNNMPSVLSLFVYKFKYVYFANAPNTLDTNAILGHSQGTQVQNMSDAALIVFFSPSPDQLKTAENNNCVKIFVVNSKQQLQKYDPRKENHVFLYQFWLKKGLDLVAVYTTDNSVKSIIEAQWNFFCTSSIIKRSSLVHDLEINVQNPSNQVIRKMIQIDSKVIVKEENLWLTYGAASGLDTVSRALFHSGNLCTDAPYYVGFDYDLTHGGAKIVFKDMFDEKTTTFDRIKMAYEEGCIGYIICNPHNPVGTMLQEKEVDEICEWAKLKDNFHLIFDEMYLNTCRQRQTKSAASYAVKFSNIHVIRGMAKDFGICGLKIGITISSNPIVMQKFNQWKPIISHHPFVISVINSLLIKSNYGTEIIGYGKQLLKEYFDIILKLFDGAGVQYVKPQAGCFVFLKLKRFLKKPTFEEEESLWKKLFYQYRVNLANGANYHTYEPGYFRVCPITDMEIMRQGVNRIIRCLRDQQMENQNLSNDGFQIEVIKNNEQKVASYVLEPRSSRYQNLTLLKKYDFVKTAQNLADNQNQQRTAIFLVIQKQGKQRSQFQQLLTSMTKSGLKCYAEMAAIINIRTNIDIITIEKDSDVDRKTIIEFVMKLVKYQSTAVLHGAEIRFKRIVQDQSSELKNNQNATLITGGSRGIGFCAAEAMAKEGRNLVITGRPGNKQLAQLAISLQQKHHNKIQALYLDIKDEQNCHQFTQKLVEKGLQLETVVFNAGVGSKTSLQQSDKNFTQVEALFEVNSLGPIRLLQMLQKKNIIKPNATLIVVSSVGGGLRGFQQMLPADICSKHILENWVDQLQKRYNVITVYPGSTDTNMFQKSTLNPLKSANKLQQFIAGSPKSMIIKPQTLGHLISLFSHSEYRNYLGGSRIAACCGLHLDYRPLLG